MIKDIRTWCNRQHGEINYYLTQFLTGHRSFGNYLKRIKKQSSDKCIYCGAPDSAEHTIFICPSAGQDHLRMEASTGVTLTPDNIVNTTLYDSNSWRDTLGVVSKIVERKERHMRDVERSLIEPPNPLADDRH